MNKTLVLVSLFVATAASAEVRFTSRVDYNSTSKHTDLTNSENASSGLSFFGSPLTRLYYTGKTGDADITVTLDLLGASATGTPAAYNLYSFAKHFYITKPFGDLYFKVGRINNPARGFEDIKNDAGDGYRTTIANGGTPLATGVSTGGFESTIPVNPGDIGGVALGYNLGDHRIEAQVTNETNQVVGTSLRRQHNMGLYFTGSFAEKMVEVRLGYLAGKINMTGTDINQTVLNIGAKGMFQGIGLTLENFMVQNKGTGTTSKASDTNSVYLAADYAMGAIKPLVKYEMSSVKIDESDSNPGSFKRSAITAAVEYTPVAEEAIRYHVAFSTVEDKYGAPLNTPATYKNEKASGHHIMAGLKYSADFLK